MLMHYNEEGFDFLIQMCLADLIDPGSMLWWDYYCA